MNLDLRDSTSFDWMLPCQISRQRERVSYFNAYSMEDHSDCSSIVSANSSASENLRLHDHSSDNTSEDESDQEESEKTSNTDGDEYEEAEKTTETSGD